MTIGMKLSAHPGCRRHDGRRVQRTGIIRPIRCSSEREGIIARDTIRSGNLVGLLTGHPLADLVAEMRAGRAYVNVHTDDGVPSPDTGPGDCPGGEIRGQI
jgi:hypothetical protein